MLPSFINCTGPSPEAPLLEEVSVAKVDQRFEAFRGELIAHLSERLGLAPHVVALHLQAWLLDGGNPDTTSPQKTSPVLPTRTRH